MTALTQDALGLFDGVGGWNVHDKELGIITLGLEKDPTAADTATKAGHNTAVVDVTGYELPREHPYSGLKASPPCGPWTVAGNGAGRRERAEILFRLDALRAHDTLITGALDPEAALVLEPARIIRQAMAYGRPFRWIVMEQTRECLPVWEKYAEWLRCHGYSVAVGNLHAEQYGVPQTRTRAVLLASKDREARLPEPTHSKYRTQAPYLLDSGVGLKPIPKRWTSMGDALPELYDNDTYLRSNYGTGGVAANRGMRALSQPAPTITRKYNRNKWIVAGEVVRPMHVSEATRLQTFPADYPWQGGQTEVQLQIGNAIPPLLARKILEQVV